MNDKERFYATHCDSIITSSRLLLRNIEHADVEQIIDISVYDGMFATTLEQALAITTKIQHDCMAGQSCHWVICSNNDGAIVGTIGFYRGFEHNSGEIGYILKAPQRGKGYASEAVQAVCQFGFSALGLTSIVAVTEHNNIASIHVLKKNGFKLQETLTDEYHFRLQCPST